MFNSISRRIALAICALLPAAAAGAGQHVTSDYSPDQDFSRLRSYTFADRATGAELQKTAIYEGPLVQARIERAVAQQLEGRGLVRDDAKPDLLITTHTSFKTQDIVYPSYGWGSGWWGYGYYDTYFSGVGSPYYVEQVTVGTLTIDLVDAHTGRLVWRGVSHRNVHPRSKPEKRTERINKEVAKVLKKYPPVDD